MPSQPLLYFCTCSRCEALSKESPSRLVRIDNLRLHFARDKRDVLKIGGDYAVLAPDDPSVTLWCVTNEEVTVGHGQRKVVFRVGSSMAVWDQEQLASPPLGSSGKKRCYPRPTALVGATATTEGPSEPKVARIPLPVAGLSATPAILAGKQVQVSGNRRVAILNACSAAEFCHLASSRLSLLASHEFDGSRDPSDEDFISRGLNEIIQTSVKQEFAENEFLLGGSEFQCGNLYQPVYPGSSVSTAQVLLSICVRFSNNVGHSDKHLRQFIDSAISSVLQIQEKARPTWLTVPRCPKLFRSQLKPLQVRPILIELCIQGCLMYWGPNQHLPACSVCGEPRLKNGKVRWAFKYYPLRDRIERWCGDADLVRLFQGELTTLQTVKLPASSDITHSLQFRMALKEAYTTGRVPLALRVSFDGFQPFSSRPDKSYEAMGVTNLLYPSAVRSCLPLFSLLAVLPPPVGLPGTGVENRHLEGAEEDEDGRATIVRGSATARAKKHLLELLVADLASVEATDMWDAAACVRFKPVIDLCIITGDLVALHQFCNVGSSIGKHPCAFCNIEGVYVPNLKTQTYPGLSERREFGLTEAYRQLLADPATTGPEREAIRRIGVSGSCVWDQVFGERLCYLKMMRVDPMHEVKNVTSNILAAMRNTHTAAGTFGQRFEDILADDVISPVCFLSRRDSLTRTTGLCGFTKETLEKMASLFAELNAPSFANLPTARADMFAAPYRIGNGAKHLALARSNVIPYLLDLVEEGCMDLPPAESRRCLANVFHLIAGLYQSDYLSDEYRLVVKLAEELLSSAPAAMDVSVFKVTFHYLFHCAEQLQHNGTSYSVHQFGFERLLGALKRAARKATRWAEGLMENHCLQAELCGALLLKRRVNADHPAIVAALADAPESWRQLPKLMEGHSGVGLFPSHRGKPYATERQVAALVARGVLSQADRDKPIPVRRRCWRRLPSGKVVCYGSVSTLPANSFTEWEIRNTAKATPVILQTVCFFFLPSGTCVAQAIMWLATGFEDELVRDHTRILLKTRFCRLTSKQSSLAGALRPAARRRLAAFDVPQPESLSVSGALLHKTLGDGTKTLFVTPVGGGGGGDHAITNVEAIALRHYTEREGFVEGVHGEGAPWQSLFGLLCWDAVFDEAVRGAWLCPIQMAPLDLNSKAFYKRRARRLNERFDWLRHADAQAIGAEVRRVWSEKYGCVCSLLHWDCFDDADQAARLASTVGGAALAAVFTRLSADFRHNRSGFPDLVVWNEPAVSARVVEVKGPGDRLSAKQRLWLHHFAQSGVSAQVCHVTGSNLKHLDSDVLSVAPDDEDD